MSGWTSYAIDPGEIRPFTFSDLELNRLALSCGTDWATIHVQAVAGHWRFLGQDWPGISGRAAWHLDPVSGLPWPSEPYCFDIGFRHEHERGDIKYVWELNRLQFLPPVAALARVNRNPEAVRYCLATIDDWADANPPFQGVNWASGIELALRSISILLTVSLLGPDTLTVAQRQRIGTILNAHAVWLMRYPSRYSSANNHLVAEAAGLYVLGTLVPSLPEAGRYRDYGRQVLIEEVERQFLDDGVGAEQSPTYASFTAELYGVALAAARAGGDAFPAAVGKRLAKVLEFLNWITDEAGHQPRYGDDDEGRVVISVPGHEAGYVTSIMSGLAAATGEVDLAPPVAVPHLRELLLGSAAPAPTGPRGLHSFDAGGYSVFRDNVAAHETTLVLDHGPLGYLSIAAHGHADALSVWLHVDGRPVFIDAGTYLYHSGGTERDHFRGTAAHNTVEINGADQSTISGAFNWSHKARAWRVEEATAEAEGACAVTARHDGYRKRFGVMHERRVEQDEAGYILTDRLVGDPVRVRETVLRFHLDPEMVAQAGDGGVVTIMRDGKAFVEMVFNTAEGKALVPVVEPTEVSPRFGVKQASTVIVLAPPVSAWEAGGAVTTRIRFR